ncbi:hypothetical protein ACOI1C_08225 [Bacillus sp. DJP31]|uniref:hypothetical protein n=1 Tax=Bacillus sp. DJP31 TaxID=3409789 RepID=UPI003BB6082E
MSHNCHSCGNVKRDHHYDHHGHCDVRNHHHNSFGHHDQFEHHHGYHGYNGHHGRKDICDRFICDDDFRLRLGGLQGGLNFRMRQLIGCVVVMELESGKKIKAKLCYVGTDFVEVKVIKVLEAELVEAEEAVVEKKPKRRRRKKKKNCHLKAMIIPFAGISFVEIEDKCDHDFFCDCHHKH